MDFNLAFQATEGLSLGISGAYYDTEFVSIKGASENPTVNGSLGKPIGNVPKFTGTAGISSDFNLTSSIPGFIRLDYSHKGRANVAPVGSLKKPWSYPEQSAVMQMLDLSSGLELNQWSIGFFVDNLLNERENSSPDPIPSLATHPKPRTVGISIGISFD